MSVQSLPKIVACVSLACLGALALGGSRYMGVGVGKAGGRLEVLATSEACPRALSPALQDPLGASSLIGGPQGRPGNRLRA